MSWIRFIGYRIFQKLIYVGQANHNTFNNEYSLATNTFNNEYLLANDTFNNEYLMATNRLLGSNIFNKELATNTFDNEYLLASM